MNAPPTREILGDWTGHKEGEMKNRRLSNDPARDDQPVRLRGHDFEPPETTSTPKKDDPPSAYDCSVPFHGSDEERSGEQA